MKYLFCGFGGFCTESGFVKVNLNGSSELKSDSANSAESNSSAPDETSGSGDEQQERWTAQPLLDNLDRLAAKNGEEHKFDAEIAIERKRSDLELEQRRLGRYVQREIEKKFPGRLNDFWNSGIHKAYEQMLISGDASFLVDEFNSVMDRRLTVQEAELEAFASDVKTSELERALWTPGLPPEKIIQPTSVEMVEKIIRRELAGRYPRRAERIFERDFAPIFAAISRNKTQKNLDRLEREFKGWMEMSLRDLVVKQRALDAVAALRKDSNVDRISVYSGDDFARATMAACDVLSAFYGKPVTADSLRRTYGFPAKVPSGLGGDFVLSVEADGSLVLRNQDSTNIVRYSYDAVKDNRTLFVKDLRDERDSDSWRRDANVLPNRLIEGQKVLISGQDVPVRNLRGESVGGADPTKEGFSAHVASRDLVRVGQDYYVTVKYGVGDKLKTGYVPYAYTDLPTIAEEPQDAAFAKKTHPDKERNINDI